jgi:hypothetical protein
MFYSNFDDNITSKYGVVIENWPLKKFCSPGDISSKPELQVLYHAWKSGSTVFRKMSRTEFEDWEDARFRERLAETVSNGADNNGSTHRVSGTDDDAVAPDHRN